MEVRDPIDVRTDTLNHCGARSTTESEQAVLNSLSVVAFIRLLYGQLPYLQTLSLGEELTNSVNEIKRLSKDVAAALHEKSLHSDWYKNLYIDPAIKDKNALVWHSTVKGEISCIYEGEKYIHREVLDEYILSYPDLFCILTSNALLFKLHDSLYGAVLFSRETTIRLFNNVDQTITAILQHIGVATRQHNITCYFI